AGHELAVGAVDGILEQNLSKALPDAALDLSLDQERVDERAEVVDRGISYDLGGAGFGIDLDFGNMTTVREGGGNRILHHMINVERVRCALRQLESAAQSRRQFEQCDRAVRAGDDETA